MAKSGAKKAKKRKTNFCAQLFVCSTNGGQRAGEFATRALNIFASSNTLALASVEVDYFYDYDVTRASGGGARGGERRKSAHLLCAIARAAC